MIDIDVDFQSSFKKKINHQIVKECESITIKKTTLEAEKRCKVQAPGPGNQLPGTKYKAVGRLRRSHSTRISDEEGLVKNSTNYWRFVVFGTGRQGNPRTWRRNVGERRTKSVGRAVYQENDNAHRRENFNRTKSGGTYRRRRVHFP